MNPPAAAVPAAYSPWEPRGDLPQRPFGNSYWLWPTRVLAGEHPGLAGPAALPARLHALAQAGITHCIDLTTTQDPVQPYQPMAPDLLTAQRLSHPITDFGLPSIAQMHAILRDITQALDAGGRVYLHCRAGIGRTGTVAATWLVEQGLTGPQALDLLLCKWQAMDKSDAEPHTPETAAQRDFVRNWAQQRHTTPSHGDTA